MRESRNRTASSPPGERRTGPATYWSGVKKGIAPDLFHAHKLTVEGLIAHRLAGGFYAGERVSSLIAFESIVVGDQGSVTGSCSDPSAADGEQRLEVAIDGKMTLNFKGKSDDVLAILLAELGVSIAEALPQPDRLHHAVKGVGCLAQRLGNVGG